MNPAENHRISHRQLYCQIVSVLTAPFLLCTIGQPGILGSDGILGIAAAAAFLSLSAVFLVRLAPIFQHPKRHLCGVCRLALGAFYLAYVTATGAFLLTLLQRLVPNYLIGGIDGRFVCAAALLVCGVGMNGGLPRRGRMAEVSFRFLIGGLLLLFLMSVSQGQISYLFETPAPTAQGIRNASYGMLCAFTPLGLLPLLLHRVEKTAGTAKPVIAAIWTLAGILAAALVLLQAAFGLARLRHEAFPILPLMAGANLPGDSLGRFDVLFMGLLLYSLLAALGNLLGHGANILSPIRTFGGGWLLAAAMLILAVSRPFGFSIAEQYPRLVAFGFCPGFFAAAVLLYFFGRKTL